MERLEFTLLNVEQIMGNGKLIDRNRLDIFKKYGVTLPHYSVSQATYGTKVSMDEIKAGDLVFYGKGNTINHVAIYIGNGQVVHASNKREGIKISNVYYRTPMTARSILID